MIGVLMMMLLLSIALNIVFQFGHPNSPSSHIDDAKIIAHIEQYLDSISPSLIAEVQSLAKDRSLPSWGCGASSYALAQILNKKFFGGTLIIKAAYDNSPHIIVERFGFVDDPTTGPTSVMVDHAWLQIYFDDQFLFIDPTIAQFGKVQGIAHHVFRVDDPDISSDLQQKYGIHDLRIRKLVRKMITGVPSDQEPYPGLIIPPDQMNYYFRVVLDRDDVEEGKMPKNWADWVKTLIDKYG